MKPHPLWLQSRPLSSNSFSLKQTCKMSALCSPFAVRKIYSAAVCFVTPHVVNSPRNLTLCNVTRLLSPGFVGLTANQLHDFSVNKQSRTADRM
jgi:hypothetical protein